MVIRTRVQSSLASGPTAAVWLDAGSLSGYADAIPRVSKCVDEVDGTRNPHSMVIEHDNRHLYSVYGRSHNIPSVPTFGWDYNGYALAGISPIISPSSGEPSDNTSLSTALARTNPNRPNADVLQTLVELKDIPNMLKKAWGRNMERYPSTARLSKASAKRALRENSDRFLEWTFGWLPLLDDLGKIMDFQGNTEKKLRQLRNLRDRGSTGGSAVVWEDEAISPLQSRFLTPLYAEGNQIHFQWVTTRKKWVSVNWIPSVPLPPQSDAGDEAIARRMAYGQGVTPALIWELMPWSWLVDWFSNVGDIMSLTRNAIPVRHSGSCIMRRTTTRFKYIGKWDGTGIFSVVPSRYPQNDIKERVVSGDAVPLPEINLPFLNGKQLGILGALTLTRTAR